jgi:hypothetical protein
MKLSRTIIVKILLLAALFTATQIQLAGTAHAALSLDYTVGGSGSIGYDTMLNVLNANGLTVTGVTGNDTPSNQGTTLSIIDGSLIFQTGALASQSGNVWNFSSGGTIALTGMIQGGQISGFPANTSTLLTGSFLSASVTQLPLGQDLFYIVGATFGGNVNSSICQYFGLSATSNFSNALNLSFTGTPLAGGGFLSSNNFGGAVVDSPQTPTPLPAVAWLFGSGLFGLFCAKKRARL